MLAGLDGDSTNTRFHLRPIRHAVFEAVPNTTDGSDAACGHLLWLAAWKAPQSWSLRTKSHIVDPASADKSEWWGGGLLGVAWSNLLLLESLGTIAPWGFE